MHIALEPGQVTSWSRETARVIEDFGKVSSVTTSNKVGYEVVQEGRHDKWRLG